MEQGLYQEERAGTQTITFDAPPVKHVKYPRAVVYDSPVRATAADGIALEYPPPSLPFVAPREFLIRVLDVLGAAVMLIAASPIMLLMAILIKVFSPGRIFYRQQRVGLNGAIFTLYKFRTMVNNAERHTGPVLALRDDSRVTPVGRLLRTTRLDELPQLFNVIRGEMSLVGPRPERPFFVERHKALQGLRLSVKPGLTGLAQVRSYYDLKPEHKIKYDFLYIRHRSVLLNIYIILKTVPVMFLKKGW